MNNDTAETQQTPQSNAPRQLIEAVIFDMDGVLADSEPHWDRIDADMLREHGVTYNGEHKRHVLGKSFQLSLQFYKETFALSHSIEQLLARRQAIAAEYYAQRIEIFEDAPRVLQSLKEMGLPIGLATSSLRLLAVPFMERHGVIDAFQAIVTGEDVERGKPAPDIYLLAAQRLKVAPSRCLVVEDSLAGVAAGTAAGMTVAAIPDPRFVAVEDYNGQADFVLNRLSEVAPLAQRLTAKTPRAA